MFERLVGNEKFKKTLLELISQKRLPHAIIIEGERGTGKHIAAKYFAAALVCDEEIAIPCEECNRCRAVFSDSYPEIRYYALEKGKTQFSVDIAREIRQQSHLKPLTGKYNISILEHSELMNSQAQNALLKILEEPPESSVFILLAENSSNFLSTVLSRCQLFRISPLSNEEVAEYIERKLNLPPDEVYPAAILSNGSIGKALDFINDEQVVEINDIASNLFSSFFSKNSIEIIKLGYMLEKNDNRDKILEVFSERLLTELKVSPDRNDKKRLLFAIEKITDARQRLLANGNKAIVINRLCAELIEYI